MNSISSAPKRPPKLGSVQTIVNNDDIFKTKVYEEITLSDDEVDEKKVKCPTCCKEMTLWSSSRREIHTKVCKANAEEKTAKKTKTKTRKLTETIERDDKVIDKKSPDPPKRLGTAWEVSKNNVKFARIAADDEANRKRKRPRSFAVVELAPKKCQCEVVGTLHSRFVDEFHAKSVGRRKGSEEAVSEHAFQMKRMIEKLKRYEQLSIDMQKATDDVQLNDFTIKCSDGEVKCHKLMLKLRTNILRTNSRLDEIQVMDVSKEAVSAWLTFLVSARIEWSDALRDEVKVLATKYGPVGLESLLNREEEVKEPVVEDKEASQELEVEEVAVEQETVEVEKEVNVFMTDDPLIGFGRALEDDDIGDEAEKELIMMEEEPSRNATLDSFDEWSNQPCPVPSSPLITSTPSRDVAKPVFGSHVKILKTSDVTPMPEFERMDENELKERMKEIGLRPKGKKAMILMLRKAYTTLHPEVCSGTPTLRPLIREEVEVVPKKVTKKTLCERIMEVPKKTTEVVVEGKEDDETDVADADKTLNLSNDEREVGRICGDDVGGEEEEEEEPGTSKGDLTPLRTEFLSWLRDDQNSVLHEHILSMQPVSLEEMLIRLEKCEGPLGRIGKGKLVKLLDALRITYQLPQKNGPRKIGGGFKRRF